MHTRRISACIGAALALSLITPAAAAPQATRAVSQKATAGGAGSITPDELKDWLSYIASDELEGRQVFHEGLGLAASYITDHLREWGVKPGGDNGSYYQDVKVLGVDTRSQSSVTVTANGQTRTFKDGEGPGRQAVRERQGGVRRLRAERPGTASGRLQGAGRPGKGRHLSGRPGPREFRSGAAAPASCA